MKYFYDRMIPSYAKKFVKKYNSDVDMVKIPLEKQKYYEALERDLEPAFKNGDKVFVEYNEDGLKRPIDNLDTAKVCYKKVNLYLYKIRIPIMEK